jgi:hypothetical protein
MGHLVTNAGDAHTGDKGVVNLLLTRFEIGFSFIRTAPLNDDRRGDEPMAVCCIPGDVRNGRCRRFRCCRVSFGKCLILSVVEVERGDQRGKIR